MLELAFVGVFKRQKTSVRPVDLMGLSYYCERELVVFLSNEVYRVAVSGLELERVPGLGAAVTGAVYE